MKLFLKNRKIFQLVLICASFYCFQAFAETKNPNTPSLSYSPQDRPNLSSGNPLKGLSKFLFFPICPTATKKSANQILKTIEQELKQIGTVTQSKILKDNEIDLQPLATAATLIYELDNLRDVKGNSLGIVRASLNLTTAIQVDATKQECNPYIWSANCFFKRVGRKEFSRIG